MRRQHSSRVGALRMGLAPAMAAPQGALQARQFSNLYTDNNKSIATTAASENS